MIIVAAPYAYSTPQLRRVRNGRRGSIEPSHSDSCNAFAHEAKAPGRRFRKINPASAHIWPPIIHPDDHRLSVFHVGHAGISA
jgi:hypothetical protein